MPKVSIVVPVYNAGNKLKKCIHSILLQTFTDYELILVDDGSTDDCGLICDIYSKKDARICVVHQENQGSVAARRKGVEMCTGDYICFCDADDTMPKNALEILYRETAAADICVGNSCRMWRGISIGKQFQPPCFQTDKPVLYDREKFLSELYCSWFGISNLPVSLCGKLFRTQLLKDSYASVDNIVHFLGEDLIITLDAMPRAEHICIIPQNVYNYRAGGGTSKYNPYMLDDWLSLYRHKRKYADKYPMPQNIQMLMDIELCNIMMTYCTMLSRSEKFTPTELDQKIQALFQIPEVISAAQNADIHTGQFKNIDLFREHDIDGILRQLADDRSRYRRKKWVRILYNRLA